MHHTHRIVRETLGISVLVPMVLISSAVGSAANGQAATPGACSLFDAAELTRVTGRKDILRQGPQQADPSETPKGVSECEFLGFSFSLTTAMTREWFDRSRASQVKSGTKTQPLAGVGDDAYYWWDPRPGPMRQVGIAYRAGKSRLVIMDLVSADSIEAVKPVLLTVAKLTAAKVR